MKVESLRDQMHPFSKQELFGEMSHLQTEKKVLVKEDRFCSDIWHVLLHSSGVFYQAL